MKHLIQSCKGKDNCLEHCPCDCHKKQFCDCYDHDFRAAVRKLAQIMDMQPINDSIRTTASMYVKTANEIDQHRYTKNLEERLEHAELHGGIVQALAERERCLAIIEQYLKHSTHNPEDTCLENIIQEIKNV